MSDKDKPVTAQEAVEAYNKLRDLCIFGACVGCPFCIGDNITCVFGKSSHLPMNWPDIKEAPDA